MSRLVMEAVAVRRGPRAVLHGVDLAFAPGRLIAVIGPNGAGKSTLLQAAAGLLEVGQGEVRLDGVPLPRLSRRHLAQRRAYLPQDARVDWPISVERVVALGLSAHLPAFGGLPTKWRPAIDGVLERHDLLALRDRPATELSGGELARTMLARATVARPDLLIVDEPTAGLDPRHALDAGDRLRTLAREGKTVIAALHDLNLAAAIADDVVAVKEGEILAAGPTRAILTVQILERLYDTPVRIVGDAGAPTIRFLPACTRS
jgi:iron complex transport system ATP-binding protein